jgi:hypothetical protein
MTDSSNGPEANNANDLAKLQLKKEIIEEQMPRFWAFVSEAQDKHQQREEWEYEADNDAYSNDGSVIPDSIQEFAKQFLDSLNAILSKI